MNLFRVAIEPMPGNFVTSGDSSGLWRTVVYKRKGPNVENEEFQYVDRENMTFEEAQERASELRKEWEKAN